MGLGVSSSFCEHDSSAINGLMIAIPFMLSRLFKTLFSQLSVRILVVILMGESSPEPLSDLRLFAESPRRITRPTWRPWTRRRPTWRRPSPPALTSTPSWWRPSRRRRCCWWSTSPTSTSPQSQKVKKTSTGYWIKLPGYT